MDWNLTNISKVSRCPVTPHVGVWIETHVNMPDNYHYVSLPTWECGLKHFGFDAQESHKGHSPRGSVDWNSKFVIELIPCKCHSPRGSVDWNNIFILGLYTVNLVTPHVGVWIETLSLSARDAASYVTPHVGVWIETAPSMPQMSDDDRHSPRGSVDWNELGERIVKLLEVTPHVGVWIETKFVWN